MPARIARASVAQKKPQTKRKYNQKRAQDAFSIATEEEPERFRVRQHRLGESEGDDSRRKRQRMEDDDESDGEPSEPKRQQRKSVAKGRFDELDIDEGSDSDGNTWRMGEVDDDDDSDIDSDDAFGESDEERFEGFTFRGSSSNQPQPKRRQRVENDGNGDIDLEDHDAAAGDQSEEDSLGEDAVDLATMLDNYESTDNEDHEDEDSEEEGEEEEDSADADSEAGLDDADGLSKLDAFISALPVDDADQNAASRRRRTGVNAGLEESSSRPKISMDDLLAADKNIKSIIPSFKQAKKYTSGKATEVPLPERQRSKLERAAADKKAKETLDRWVDTVKHNRRAEHISFPLIDDKNAEPLGARQLLSKTKSATATELESAIADIMQQSGLASDEKDEEKQLQEFEELQMNKMPIEEVQARRAALRQARDLMFREEIKAKRIKKIKSKAYRRVHRKERERQAMRDVDVFGEGEMDDEEREKMDRRRAEERMGAKHRDSKWAKSIKKTGQAAWDDDARDGITDMARRNEELRRRQQGRDVSDSDGLSASEDDGSDDDISDDEAARRKYERSLTSLDNTSNAKRSGLSGMKFMQDAEAVKRAQNEEDMERLRRELDGEDPFDLPDEENRVIGRRQYGPQVKLVNDIHDRPSALHQSEFEAQQEASSDEEAEIIVDSSTTTSDPQRPAKKASKASKAGKGVMRTQSGATVSAKISKDSKDDDEEQNPFLNTKRRKHQREEQSPEIERETEGALLPGEVHSRPDADGFTTVTYKQVRGTADADTSDDEEDELPTLSRNQQLVQQAFAGDDTFEDFSKEKKELAAEDDDKVTDNSMPGWGSWTGDNLTRRDKRMAASIKNRLQTVQKGIRPEDRKDAKLKHVIINEKRVKKNGQYLANQLPFPYNNRQEYERSMRMPVGGEWNTKTIVQKNTQPRVLVKPGRVITALEAPLL